MLQRMFENEMTQKEIDDRVEQIKSATKKKGDVIRIKSESAEIKMRVKEAEIPRRYMGKYDPSMWDNDMRSFFDTFDFSAMKSVFLQGDRGIGKSFMGGMMLLEYCKEIQAQYISDARLAMLLNSDKTMWETYNHMARVPILMIDDVGRGRYHQNGANARHEIYEERYAEGLPIILCTNYDLKAEKFVEEYGPQWISRIYEMCGKDNFKTFTNRDLRREA